MQLCLQSERGPYQEDGVVHNYIYASGKLLRETYGNNVLDFFYDSNGTPFALKYNGTLYYYITNLQGDVMNLVDANGTVVATYDYDPFGNVIGLEGTMATTNPLRYRGYYYDSESSLYYLQSRYYDPAIGRFINADSYASTGQDIIGHNMFAYCNNNPVLYTDSMGLWPSLADVFTTVAATIAVVATVVACVAAVPVFMGVGGTAVVASATAVASASAKVATVAGATALVAQKTKQHTKTYTIYTLSDPETKDVVYVGRTSNYPVRMQAHSLNVYRRGLDPKILHENLNYLQARAAEQAYILYYSTINKSDKKYNQINGVNPRRTDYTPIMKNGFGISEALDSILTNKIMCLLE